MVDLFTCLNLELCWWEFGKHCNICVLIFRLFSFSHTMQEWGYISSDSTILKYAQHYNNTIWSYYEGLLSWFQLLRKYWKEINRLKIGEYSISTTLIKKLSLFLFHDLEREAPSMLVLRRQGSDVVVPGLKASVWLSGDCWDRCLSPSSALIWHNIKHSLTIIASHCTSYFTLKITLAHTNNK